MVIDYKYYNLSGFVLVEWGVELGGTFRFAWCLRAQKLTHDCFCWQFQVGGWAYNFFKYYTCSWPELLAAFMDLLQTLSHHVRTYAAPAAQQKKTFGRISKKFYTTTVWGCLFQRGRIVPNFCVVRWLLHPDRALLTVGRLVYLFETLGGATCNFKRKSVIRSNPSPGTNLWFLSSSSLGFLESNLQLRD